ncbi:acetyl-CoA carboxylase [Agrobacterium sp. NPDC090283]|uniref:acetyl-CoA carboxylase n=1 Tax=Agrobacterium sp. NPDC090283 TaxID=3363920 RepID=UPI00383AFC34
MSGTVAQVFAPIPGVIYRRPSPDKPVFANEGDMVAVGDTIALVEVMKSFYPVTTEVAGKVVRFLVDAESEVSPGEAIAEIEVTE